MSTFNYPGVGTASNPLPVTGVMTAGEAFIGTTGAVSVSITGTVGTQTNGAYTSGDWVGTLMTLTGAARVAAGNGWIQRVTITSKSAQTGAFEVWFFNANPSSTTVTDNGVADVADADLSALIGAVSCSDVKTLSGSSVHLWQGNLAFGAASGTSIYAFIVTRSGNTLASTSDLQFTMRVLQN